LLEHDRPITRAWVIHPDVMSLAAALPDLDVVGSEVVPLPKMHPGKLFGKGKIAELKQRLHDAEIALVLIDGPVSPVQQRNLEKEWDVKILDRTGLILEIFSDRARTAEGVLQVEMAALSYQRTRLVRAWTHLERQRGGLGFVGGPGETQIEADRRAIDLQLKALRQQLEKVVKTRTLHRAARAKVPFPIVALVGYTNAGKSTLFNRLTGAEVFAKDMLFATLDPTMRKITLPSGDDVIMSDTVGFISDLPTELVGVAEGAPLVEVWNKIDQLPQDERDAVITKADRTDDLYAVSAITGDGMPALLDDLASKLKDPRKAATLSLGFADGRARAWLFEQGIVTSEEQTETGYEIEVFWTDLQQSRYAKL